MIRLSSSNYRSIEYLNADVVTLGQLVVASTFGGSLNGFAFTAFGAAAKGTYVTYAEKAKATKVPGDALAFAPGEKVYYNIAGAKVSKTTTDVFIGYATEAAVAADTIVNIEFNGALSGAALLDVDGALTNNDTLKYVTATGKLTAVAVAD